MDRATAAEHRTARLQATATALAQVMSPAEAGLAVLEQALAVFEAAAGAVYLRDGDTLRPQVEILGRRPPYMTVAVSDAYPLGDAMHTGAHYFFESQAELVSAYPLAAARVPDVVQATIVLALAVKARVFGAIVLSFEAPRAFSPEERGFADAIAAQCALAIDRALLMEREHAAVARAELLDSASALLASSLDPAIVLQQLVQLVVPSFADWCVVEMLDGDVIRESAAAHADAARAAQVAAYRRRYPWTARATSGYWQVVRTGKPLLLAVIDPAMFDTPQLDPEERTLLRALGMRSVIVAALHARGRTLGTITFVWADSPRQYSAEELALCVELAYRAAMAVDNATLYRDLKKAVEVRDDFLAAAGHELKTPLAALLMHIESMQRALAREAVPRNQPERLDKAARAGKRLEKLIDELLDVSRITAGRLRLDPEALALDEVVGEVIDRFAEQAASAGCELTLHTEPTPGRWDRSRIDQVVSNLVVNAIKYGHGAPIHVEVRPLAAGIAATIRVTDHGIGIAASEQHRIFERFERVVEHRSFGGFGLGLWIARQIVDASGGTITVQSEPGHGATFAVTLPVSDTL